MIVPGLMNNAVKKNIESRWKPPELNALKINMNAPVFKGARTFFVGMVSRDHVGSFVAGQTVCFSTVESVVEAELMGINEALSWA